MIIPYILKFKSVYSKTWVKNIPIIQAIVYMRGEDLLDGKKLKQVLQKDKKYVDHAARQ